VPFRYAAGFSGFVLFVLYLQLVGRFAAGEPMLPSARPVPAQAHYARLVRPGHFFMVPDTEFWITA
jgi:hypothetical protein